MSFYEITIDQAIADAVAAVEAAEARAEALSLMQPACNALWSERALETVDEVLNYRLNPTARELKVALGSDSSLTAEELSVEFGLPLDRPTERRLRRVARGGSR